METATKAACPIPAGVYWSAEHDNFYCISADRRGMGVEFYRQWRDRAAEFPAAPSTPSAPAEPETGKVDLSLAQPGDQCLLRNGTTVQFCGPTLAGHDYIKTHPFWTGWDDGRTYKQDGTYSTHTNHPHDYDILRVTRNGIQITPAPSQPASEAGETEKPEAVIKGPGVYRTERWEESGKDRHLAHVEAHGNGKWYGWIGLEDICMAWDSDGRCLSPGTVIDITGPYVEPPKPVLTITEKRTEDGWVHAWTEYSGEFQRALWLVRGMVSLVADLWCVGELNRHTDCLSVHPRGPLVCTEYDWPRVQELVAAVNAEAGKG